MLALLLPACVPPAPTAVGAPALLYVANSGNGTVAQLDSLPGIGPARAAAIVRYRDQHGPFGSLTELTRVPGINPALLQRLSDRLQVP